MRTPVIAGNWKMFKTVAEATVLVREMRRELNNIKEVVKILCPPFTALSAVADLVQKTDIQVGAQDLYWEEQGAFTGEVSPGMVKELCQYVIIGHSERRQYFGETDESVNRKVKVALKHGLIPIVCVGENLAQNEAGQTEAFVSSQVRAALRDLTAEQVRGLVIAYEPIWAIGTGKAATGAGANRIIGLVVRGTVASLFGESVAQAVRIQYGGSVSPDNIAEFMNQPEIDGALVGGASLVGSKFLTIARQAAASKGPSPADPAMSAGRTAPFGPRDPARWAVPPRQAAAVGLNEDETALAGRRSSRATKVLREGSRPERGRSSGAGRSTNK